MSKANLFLSFEKEDLNKTIKEFFKIQEYDKGETICINEDVYIEECYLGDDGINANGEIEVNNDGRLSVSIRVEVSDDVSVDIAKEMIKKLNKFKGVIESLK